MARDSLSPPSHWSQGNYSMNSMNTPGVHVTQPQHISLFHTFLKPISTSKHSHLSSSPWDVAPHRSDEGCLLKGMWSWRRQLSASEQQPPEDLRAEGHLPATLAATSFCKGNWWHLTVATTSILFITAFQVPRTARGPWEVLSKFLTDRWTFHTGVSGFRVSSSPSSHHYILPLQTTLLNLEFQSPQDTFFH